MSNDEKKTPAKLLEHQIAVLTATEAIKKLKAKLRKANPRTHRAVNHWIAKICKTFSIQECLNYFKSCGYSN